MQKTGSIKFCVEKKQAPFLGAAHNNICSMDKDEQLKGAEHRNMKTIDKISRCPAPFKRIGSFILQI
jgi:hypothetical protein